MKTIFITGASSGIGRATVRHFAERGWNVVATMRTPEKEIEFMPLNNVLVLKLDVEKKETIQNAVTKAIQHFGKIDVLLNNAGYGTMGILEAATDEQIRRQFEVNVFGLINMTKAMLPHFRSNQEGMLINISSMGGIVTFPTMSLYHSTKFAVEGLSESLSYELLSQNIKVKLIEPGAIHTDFGGRSMEFYFDDSLTDYKQFTTTFLGKLSEMEKSPTYALPPELVAEAIFQAATDGTNQFRYVIGEDAKMLIQMKEDCDDEDYLSNITQHFLNQA
ncbi:NAD(P)-dependent dehydrogenase (short-subunit alcohol dehydrogenase family) [Paenibacillus anaericanus]|uniref:SDR family oxidoreductase n=1 Tax=Paenibacillus anaericanus TaxID=170367 RepID=UPI002787134D|nr:SDR family oxidoreductase [Paenibacillus anaericanus]MDQ0089118.1 NAD(P)-dependent dehydrogenase (short-subunit alcohol dehydrogenase family) [Paenibacillus anaericanus]